MATRTKKTTTDTITVASAVEQLQTTEQAVRLALIDIRPDDFDTVKALPLLDFEAVAAKLSATSQPQLLATPQNPETSAQQDLEPTTEQPQSALCAPQQQQRLTSPTQSPQAPGQLGLIEQLVRQAEEEITAVDALATLKNRLIINNLAVKRAELQEHVNQHWQGEKSQYLDSIRGLSSLAQSKPEITPDATDLDAEIDSILSDLGKSLAA
jgi:hypothetical protein